MTNEQELLRSRIEHAARVGKWWDSDELARKARQWLSGNPNALRIGRGQWQALIRAVGNVGCVNEFLVRINEFLRAAAQRDRKGSTWGQPGLTDSLINAIEQAIQGQSDPRTQAVEQLLTHLPPDDQRDALASKLMDDICVAKGREFLRLLFLATVESAMTRGGTE